MLFFYQFCSHNLLWDFVIVANVVVVSLTVSILSQERGNFVEEENFAHKQPCVLSQQTLFTLPLWLLPHRSQDTVNDAHKSSNSGALWMFRCQDYNIGYEYQIW